MEFNDMGHNNPATHGNIKKGVGVVDVLIGDGEETITIGWTHAASDIDKTGFDL